MGDDFDDRSDLVAADETIRRLREENARLREQIASNAIRASGVLAKQAEELHEVRVRLARCVTALARLAGTPAVRMVHTDGCPCPLCDARAALAAAKGE